MIVSTDHHRHLIKSDIQISYQLFQSTQTMNKAFVEISEGPLLFPPDPVSRQLQLVGIIAQPDHE